MQKYQEDPHQERTSIRLHKPRSSSNVDVSENAIITTILSPFGVGGTREASFIRPNTALQELWSWEIVSSRKNGESSTCSHCAGARKAQRRKAMSNLSVLMNQHQASVGIPVEIQVSAERGLDEADSASGHLCGTWSLLLPICSLLLECSIEVDQPHLCVRLYRLSRRFSSGIGGMGTPPSWGTIA
jgi:hypothetical protein